MSDVKVVNLFKGHSRHRNHLRCHHRYRNPSGKMSGHGIFKLLFRPIRHPHPRYSYYLVRDCVAIISLFFAIPRDRP